MLMSPGRPVAATAKAAAPPGAHVCFTCAPGSHSDRPRHSGRRDFSWRRKTNQRKKISHHNASESEEEDDDDDDKPTRSQ